MPSLSVLNSAMFATNSEEGMRDFKMSMLWTRSSLFQYEMEIEQLNLNRYGLNDVYDIVHMNFGFNGDEAVI